MRTVGRIIPKPPAAKSLEIDGEKLAEKVTEKKSKASPKSEKADDAK